VGAGGLGDAIYTAISLFHIGDLLVLLVVMTVLVAVIDYGGDRLRRRLLVGPAPAPGLREADVALARCQPVADSAVPSAYDAATLFYRVGAHQNYQQGSILEITHTGMVVGCVHTCPPGVVVQWVLQIPEGEPLQGAARIARVTAEEHGDAGYRLHLDTIHDAHRPRLREIARTYCIAMQET
jgi:phosphonate transport system permease protein